MVDKIIDLSTTYSIIPGKKNETEKAKKQENNENSGKQNKPQKKDKNAIK